MYKSFSVQVFDLARKIRGVDATSQKKLSMEPASPEYELTETERYIVECEADPDHVPYNIVVGYESDSSEEYWDNWWTAAMTKEERDLENHLNRFDWLDQPNQKRANEALRRTLELHMPRSGHPKMDKFYLTEFLDGDDFMRIRNSYLSKAIALRESFEAQLKAKKYSFLAGMIDVDTVFCYAHLKL